MRSPWGDHAGLPSFSPALVRRRGEQAPVGSSHRLVRPVFSSIEYEVTAHTAALPSGDIATVLIRSSAQSVSTSIGLRGMLVLALVGGSERHDSSRGSRFEPRQVKS